MPVRIANETGMIASGLANNLDPKLVNRFTKIRSCIVNPCILSNNLESIEIPTLELIVNWDF